MPTETCLVTVIIPVFNSAATLWRAARSALRQDVSPIEVIIVDDDSRDSSLTEALRIAEGDSRVRVIALPANRGKPHAMNRAIEEARGTWIAVLDADDCYADDRLATLIDAAKQNDADLVADNQFLFDAAADQLVGTALPDRDHDAPLTRHDFIAGSDAYANFNLGMLKPVIRADFVRRNDLRYRENARLSEDFLYLIEFFAAGGRAFLVSRPLYYWTQAFGSLSRRWTDTGAGPWRYDFLSALAANAEVREALCPSVDADLIALLDRRERAFRQLHWLAELSRSRRENHRLAGLFLRIARRPSIWPLIIRRALRASKEPGDMPGLTVP
jgi:succinoglycan biosynthesis protein ExoO